LGDPKGTYDLGGPPDKSEATRQAHQDGALPTNEPWNHALRRNQPIEDAMMIPKPGGRKRTRFCMQNPNGIQVNLGGKWKENCKHQKDMEVDWMGYSGNDLNTGNNSVMWRLKEDAYAVFGHNSHKMVTSHTNRESSSNRKPGGTMALVTGWLKDKVFETGYDPYGRWVHTKIRGNGGRILTFICTYQVCQNNRNNIRELGESTFAKQQMSMFTEEDRRDPRRLRYHHRRDLVRFVQECQNAGELVSVGGDFNEVLGLEDADGLARLCTDCGLVDIILAKHGRTDFDTYIRGSKVLDYFLIPLELEDAVLACGYEPYNIRTMGDHRAFSSGLLGGSTFAGGGCRAGCGRSGAGRCVGTHNVLRLERGSLASPRGSLQTGYTALIKQLMCFGDHCGRSMLVGVRTLAIFLAESGSQPIQTSFLSADLGQVEHHSSILSHLEADVDVLASLEASVNIRIGDDLGLLLGSSFSSTAVAFSWFLCARFG